MSGEPLDSFTQALDRIQCLAVEVGGLRHSIREARDQLAKAEKECQELRDALAEAVRGLRDREPVSRSGVVYASDLDRILDSYGVPESASEGVLGRLRFALSSNSMLRQQRTTQDG